MKLKAKAKLAIKNSESKIAEAPTPIQGPAPVVPIVPDLPSPIEPPTG